MNFMQRALDFLKNHVEIAFATSESNRLHIRIFHYNMKDHTVSDGFVGEIYSKRVTILSAAMMLV